MSRSEKIAKMATTTASQAKQNSTISKKRKKARKGVLFEAHKHCVECSIPIPLSYDSLICEDEECKINQEKKEKSRHKEHRQALLISLDQFHYLFCKILQQFFHL